MELSKGMIELDATSNLRMAYVGLDLIVTNTNYNLCHPVLT